MKYFAPCPEVADAYTKLILQHLNYYRSRLKQVQALSVSTLPWGESVKAGRHQSKTIDKKKRGQNSIYLFDSEDDDNTERTIEDSALGNSQNDQDASNVFEELEVLKKRKIDSIEPSSVIRNDQGDKFSLNLSKRQKVTETVAECEDQKFDAIPSSITEKHTVMETLTPARSTRGFSIKNESISVSGCVENKEVECDVSPILLKTTPNVNNGVRNSSYSASRQDHRNKPACSDNEEEMLLEQQKKHRRNQRNKAKAVRETCETALSPKFKKRLSLRKKPVELNPASDDESISSSATSTVSTTMLDPHGDIFSTQVCRIKERKEQSDKDLSQVTDSVHRSLASQSSKLKQLFDSIHVTKSNLKENKHERSPKVEIKASDEKNDKSDEKSFEDSSLDRKSENKTKQTDKVKKKFKRKMVVVTKQPEKKTLDFDQVINVDTSESNGSDPEINEADVPDGTSTGNQSKPSQPCVRGHVDKETCVRGHVDKETCVRGHVDKETCVRGHVDKETSRVSMASSTPTGSGSHNVYQPVKPFARTNVNTKMTPKRGVAMNDDCRSNITAGGYRRTDSPSMLSNATDKEKPSSQSPRFNSNGDRMGRAYRSVRSSSIASDDSENYRTPKSVTRKRQANEDQMSHGTKSAKQEVPTICCPLCNQPFPQAQIEVHASGCEGFVEGESTQPEETQKQISRSESTGRRRVEEEFHSENNRVVDTSEHETMMDTASTPSLVSQDLVESEGREVQKTNQYRRYRQDMLAESSPESPVPAPNRLPTDDDYNPSYQEDSGSSSPDKNQLPDIDGQSAISTCYICDESFTNETEFSRHMEACIENATRWQHTVDRRGFQNALQADTREEPTRATRSRSRHRSGEMRTIQQLDRN